MINKCYFKKLHPDAILPSYACEGDSGMDLYSIEDTFLVSGEYKAIRTGLGIVIPKGFEAQIRPKSGRALKEGLTVLNTPGTVDNGYTGEIQVILINHSEYANITKGQKIAQLVIAPVATVQPEWIEELPETERGNGGFGSTGL